MYLNTSDITAISIAIIALCSFVLSLYTLRMIIKHNVISVKPLCSILINDYEYKVCLKLKNTGNGPLIITDLSFINSDKIVNKNLLKILPKISYSDYTEEFKGRSIYPNDELIIFSIEDLNVLKTHKDGVRNILKDITVIVDYKDIYGNKCEYEERKLSFFGRHSGVES